MDAGFAHNIQITKGQKYDAILVFSYVNDTEWQQVPA
jgi:hypothetical protein